MSYIELGGFAEDIEDIDGTEEEFNAFNYCLAEEYLGAMYLESFDELGTVSGYLLETICYWLGRHNNHEVIEQIKNGTLITKNNRTFIDAIYENRNSCFAEVYINNGIITPKLMLTILISNDDTDIWLVDLEQNELEKIINELYDFIEQEFEKIDDKDNFVISIKNGWTKIKINRKCTNKSVPSHYNWVKHLKNIGTHVYTLDKQIKH